MVPQKDLLLGVAGVLAPFFLCGVFIVSEQAAAIPKSHKATWPCLSTSTFAGLRSRCTCVSIECRAPHAIDATRVHQTRSWVVSSSILRSFGPRRLVDFHAATDDALRVEVR